MSLKSWNPLLRISYRLFNRLTPDFPAFKEVYDQSGIFLSYEAYMSLAFFVFTIVFSAVFPTAFLFHAQKYLPDVFKSRLLFGDIFRLFLFTLCNSVILPSLVIAWVFSGSAVFLILAYPVYQRNNRGKQIDNSLFYTVSFAAILASAGIPLERLIERMANVTTDPAIENVFRRIVRNIKVFGLDIASAIEETIEHTPSTFMSKILKGMLTATQTSGELTSYLDFQVKRLFVMKQQKLEKTVTSLTYMGEMYIALLVVGPIVMILTITLLSSFGGSILGLPPVAQINLIVFIAIPVLAIVFIILIDTIVGGGEA